MKLKGMMMAAAALAIVGASGCAGPVQQQMQQLKAQDNLAEASREASIGQTAKAKKLVDAAISADPGDVTLYIEPAQDSDLYNRYSVASVFADVGDDVTEVAYLQQAVSKFPKDYGPLYLLLQVQIRLGDTARVQTAKSVELILQAQIGKGNIDADSLLSLADAEWQAGDRTQAVADCNRCMKLYPSSDEAWNELAYDYACANDKPNLQIAATYANIALSKARRNDEPDEDIGEIQDTLGWVEYHEGLYGAAMNDIDQAIEADPRQPEVRYHHAMVYLATGDKPAAKAELERALLLDPAYADAKNAIAQLGDVVVKSPTVQAQSDLEATTAGSGIDFTADAPAQPKPKGNP